MKIHAPRFYPEDENTIGRVTKYVFGLPCGFRCIARTNGTDIKVVVLTNNGDKSTHEDITGFAPDVEEEIKLLYTAMKSEPDPKVTLNGKQVVFDPLIFDFMLHDRTDRLNDDGKADNVIEAMDDWDEMGMPMRDGTAMATVLCAMSEEEYNRGRTSADLWFYRAWIKRGLTRNGLYRPYLSGLRPILVHLRIISSKGDREGTAEYEVVDVWKQVEEVFNRGYAYALIPDVWSGWNVTGKQFRTISEGSFDI